MLVFRIPTVLAVYSVMGGEHEGRQKEDQTRGLG